MPNEQKKEWLRKLIIRTAYNYGYEARINHNLNNPFKPEQSLFNIWNMGWRHADFESLDGWEWWSFV